MLIESKLSLADLALPRVIYGLSVAKHDHMLNNFINNYWIGCIIVDMNVQVFIYGMREILDGRSLIHLMGDDSFLSYQFLHIHS